MSTTKVYILGIREDDEQETRCFSSLKKAKVAAEKDFGHPIEWLGSASYYFYHSYRHWESASYEISCMEVE